MTRSRPVALLLLVLLALPGLALPMGPVSAQSTSDDPSLEPWWNASFPFRISVTVGPQPYDFREMPASWQVDFSAIFDELGLPAGPKLDNDSLRLIEVPRHAAGVSPIAQMAGGPPYIDPFLVPVSFHRYDDGKPGSQAGRIEWDLAGLTRTGAIRSFTLYFDFDRSPSGHPPADYLPTHDGSDRRGWTGPGTTLVGYDPGVEASYGNHDELHVLGLYNGTTVSLWNTTLGVPILRDTVTLSARKVWNTKVPDGSSFLLQSNRPVIGSVDVNREKSGGAKGFYPGLTGRGWDTEFLFRALPTDEWESDESSHELYTQGTTEIRISEVDKDGAELSPVSATIDVAGLSHHDLDKIARLRSGVVYHITSSAPIAIDTHAINAFTAVPSLDGTPIGKHFVGSLQSFQTDSLVILAVDRGVAVVVHDLDGLLPSVAGAAKPGQPLYLNGTGFRYFDVQAGPNPDKVGEFAVIAGSTEGGDDLYSLGDDITFLGGRAGRHFPALAIRNPPPGGNDPKYPVAPAAGLVFGLENDTWVTIDGRRAVFGWGESIPLDPGPHDVLSDRPVSVLSIGRGKGDDDRHRWNDWGTFLAGTIASPPVIVVNQEAGRYGLVLEPGPGERLRDGRILHAALPGGIATFSISLRSTGTWDDTAVLDITDPVGWNPQGLPASVALARKVSLALEIRITVPANASGDSEVRFALKATSVGDPSVSAVIDLAVFVDPTFLLEVTPAGDQWIFPWEQARYRIPVRNTGNTNDTARAELHGAAPGWTTSVEPGTLLLQRNANGTLNLTVTPPADSAAGTLLAVEVRAISVGNVSRSDSVVMTTHIKQFFSFDANLSPAAAHAGPGGIARLGVTLANKGNGPDTVGMNATGHLVAGAADHLLATAATPLLHRGSATIDVPVAIPTGTPVGTFPVTLRLDDGHLNRTLVGSVTVDRVVVLRLTSREFSQDARPGQAAVYHLQLENLGNAADKAAMSVAPIKGKFTPASAQVAANGSLEIVLTIVAPKKEQTYSLVVAARGESGASTNTTIELRVAVPRDRGLASGPSLLWVFGSSTLALLAGIGGCVASDGRRGRY